MCKHMTSIRRHIVEFTFAAEAPLRHRNLCVKLLWSNDNDGDVCDDLTFSHHLCAVSLGRQAVAWNFTTFFFRRLYTDLRVWHFVDEVLEMMPVIGDTKHICDDDDDDVQVVSSTNGELQGDDQVGGQSNAPITAQADVENTETTKYVDL